MATFCDNASIPYTPYDTLAAVAEGIERFAGSRPTAAAVALPERYFPPYKQQDPSRNLLELERKYCSWGDTVHYLDPPKCFERSEGSYLYDREGSRGNWRRCRRTGTPRVVGLLLFRVYSRLRRG